MIGTNNQIILKLDPSDRGPVMELIAIGSIGSDNKLSGVRTWNRIASYTNIEWSNVNIRGNRNNNALWIEISDANRLIKLIKALKALTDTVTADGKDIQVLINESDWIMRHQTTNTSVSLPVRWFDSKWAAATVTYPSISAPSCCVKLVSGLDQISAILKRVDKWREEWSVDLLSVAVDRGRRAGGVWDIKFVAETSTPPHVKLSASLPNCPEQQLSIHRSFESCEVSVSLSAATRALISPLADNDRLCTATTGIALLLVPEEGLACNINWNSLGLGQITTTIYIPSRIH